MRIEDHIKIRYIMLNHFEKGLTPGQSFRNLTASYGNEVISKSSVEKLFARLKSGHKGAEDKEGRGGKSDLDDNALLEAVEQNESQTTRALAEQFAVHDSTIVRHLQKLGKDEDLDYVVSEYFPSKTLLEYDMDYLTVENAIRAFAQVVLGLEAFRVNGLYHNDIIERNLLIDENNYHLKIIDFEDADKDEHAYSPDFGRLVDIFYKPIVERGKEEDHLVASQCGELFSDIREKGANSKYVAVNQYGLEEIKKHECFAEINWKQLYQEGLEYEEQRLYQQGIGKRKRAKYKVQRDTTANQAGSSSSPRKTTKS